MVLDKILRANNLGEVGGPRRQENLQGNFERRYTRYRRFRFLRGWRGAARWPRGGGVSFGNAFYSRPGAVLLLGTFHLCMNIRERASRVGAPAIPFHVSFQPPNSPVLSGWLARIQSTIKPRPLKIYRPESRDTSPVPGHRGCYFVRMSSTLVRSRERAKLAPKLHAAFDGISPVIPRAAERTVHVFVASLHAQLFPLFSSFLFFENARTDRASSDGERERAPRDSRICLVGNDGKSLAIGLTFDLVLVTAQ